MNFINKLFEGDVQTWETFSDASIAFILIVFAALIAVNVIAAVS